MFSRLFSVVFLLLCKSLQLVLFFLSKNPYLRSAFNCFQKTTCKLWLFGPRFGTSWRGWFWMVFTLLVQLTTYGSASQAEMGETLIDGLCWGKVQQEKEVPVLPLPATGGIPPLLGDSQVATTLLIKFSPIMGHLMFRKFLKLSSQLLSLLLYINIVSISLVWIMYLCKDLGRK